MCFLKSVKIQPVEMSIQPVFFTLSGFEKLDFVVKPIQPVVSTIQLVLFLKTLTEFC